MTTPPPRRIDSLRAKRMSAKKVFTLLDIVFDWIICVNEGAAKLLKMAMIANTTMSSSNVNP